MSTILNGSSMLTPSPNTQPLSMFLFFIQEVIQVYIFFKSLLNRTWFWEYNEFKNISKVVMIHFSINNCSLRKMLITVLSKQNLFLKKTIYCLTPEFCIFLRKELDIKVCTLQKLNRYSFKGNINKLDFTLPQLEMNTINSPPDDRVKFDFAYSIRTWGPDYGKGRWA